ncbi:glyceraldehyde-3-phosphate dehydrogenase (NAD(P)) [Fontibacillus solani]|uniref:Glyceraldehyde-3-phosphate dehydrogenase (NAD(P)) n=1 Tax=Fontibacillus solani TaxID=1572857 RepID=A0A7W3SVZ8_9BACL|nr:type II glyceraldehyde-3-phosphate dehydrogenase [Fontibacillus solani]MBA9087204.1 glyceraldehyde-3-phosphate dehydrogenase (NAD(P)) [Fontibacillus solani]
MTIKVGITGFGTIGKRVAEAIGLQNDMCLKGVVFRNLNIGALTARLKGMPIYLDNDAILKEFIKAGVQPLGNLTDLLMEIDIMVDCTPRGQAEKNLPLYKRYNIPVILQGGEKDELGLTFNSFINMDAVKCNQVIRIASCNTTGIVRILFALFKEIDMDHVFVSLVRCASDPDKGSKGIVNGLGITSEKSHHAQDVQLLLPDVHIYTKAVAAPMTHGHILFFSIDIRSECSEETLIKRMNEHPRLIVLPGLHSHSTSTIEAFFSNRKRRDRPYAVLLEDSIEIIGNKLFFIASIHMESIVIPETIDCIRAKFSDMNASDIIMMTDHSMHMDKETEAYKNLL